jgi:hypothetical protein
MNRVIAEPHLNGRKRGDDYQRAYTGVVLAVDMIVSAACVHAQPLRRGGAQSDYAVVL